MPSVTVRSPVREADSDPNAGDAGCLRRKLAARPFRLSRRGEGGRTEGGSWEGSGEGARRASGASVPAPDV